MGVPVRPEAVRADGTGCVQPHHHRLARLPREDEDNGPVPADPHRLAHEHEAGGIGGPVQGVGHLDLHHAV